MPETITLAVIRSYDLFLRPIMSVVLHSKRKWLVANNVIGSNVIDKRHYGTLRPLRVPCGTVIGRFFTDPPYAPQQAGVSNLYSLSLCAARFFDSPLYGGLIL